MKKMAKKKLIRVEYDKNFSIYNRGYTQGTLAFGLLNSELEEEDGIRYRTQVSDFVTCRDQLCLVPYYAINGGSLGDIYDRKDNGLPDLNQLRLVMGTKIYKHEEITEDDIKKRIFSAKRGINLLEEHAGWTPSTITSIVHTKVKGGQAWLFTGESRWIKCAQMISLCGLIFRLARRNGCYNTDNVDAFIKSAKDLGGSKNKCESNDRQYVKDIFPYLKKLFENFDNVFEGDQKQYYPAKIGKGFLHSGGMHGLFKKETGNVALHKRLNHYVLKGKEEK
jgi:hypothetical protein